MSGVLSAAFGAGAQFFNNQGVVLAGGMIYTYQAGTTISTATYTDSTQLVQNANPIILDSAGRVPTEVWLINSATYKFVLTDAIGNVLGTWDNIPGVNMANVILSEWLTGPTPTYISASSFSVSGNYVSTYQVSRRIQYSVAGGTYYGTIATSSYGAGVTTVTFTADSTGMDNTLSGVNYGFMSAVNTSIPTVFASTVVPNVWTGATNNFTGSIVTVATQAPLTNSTKAASTAYTDAAVAVEKSRAQTAEALLVPIAGAAYTGSHNFTGATVTVATQTALDNSTKAASTAYTDAAVGVETSARSAATASLAPIANPTFTGTPAAPTPVTNVNTTQIVTGAWVNTYFAALAGAVFTGSQNFTGATVTVATQAPGDSSTKAASTAFVMTQAFSSALPAQAGNAGNWVTTNGTTASWQPLPSFPDINPFLYSIGVI